MSKLGLRIAGRTGSVLQSRVGPACAVLMTLTVVAGCAQGQGTAATVTKAQAGTSAPPTAAPSASTAAGLPVMTRAQTDALGSVAAGQLTLSGGCFYLTSPDSTKQIDLVWPHGFTAGKGSMGVYDGDGTLVAKPGDNIILGGGPEILAHLSPGTIANPQCLTGTTTAWIIASVGHK